MHLHSMTLQALGPFPGTHSIDFARLGASGIFLLEGPTGAGKSTIIDAVVFALYGKVASKDASEDRLRSGHAGPQVETFVDLVLESGSGIYRVRRTPAYDRPKQRGSGTTRQQSTVRLWRLTSPDAPHDGELMSSRLDEAGPELERIIGLDRAQFVQTVVLPQGEFASFLRADPEHRRGLLQRVFGTEIYEQLQVRLERMRVECGRAVEDARQRVDRAVAGYLGAAGLDDEAAATVRAAADHPVAEHPVAGHPAVGPGTAGLREVVDAGTAALDAEATEARCAAAIATSRHRAAAAALAEARAVAAALQRRTGLRADLERLTARAPEQVVARGRLAAARRAAAVLPLVTGADQAQDDVVAATAALAQHRAGGPPDVRDLVDDLTDTGVQRKALLGERDRCTAERATLTRALDLEQGLGGRRGEIGAAVEARRRLVSARDLAVADLATRPERRLVVTTELEHAATSAAGLPAAEQDAALARAALLAARDLARLTEQLERAQGTVTAAAATAQQAVTRCAELHSRRIAGIAGELAARLVPGDPCAVCGGTEHPHPAPLDPGHVDEADLEQAELARTMTGRALADASAHLSTLVERVDGRRAAAQGADPAQAEATLALAAAAVETSRAAVVRRAELTAGLTDLDQATRQVELQVGDLGTRLAVADATLAGLRAQLADAEAEVAAARLGAPTVAARVAELEARAALVSAWAEAAGVLADAVAQHLRRTDELATALADRGFDDASAVRSAHLDEAALAAVDQAVTTHERALARVEEGLAEPDIVALPQDVRVDLTAAGQVHTEAEEAAALATGAAARARHRADAAGAAGVVVAEALTEHLAAQRVSGPVVRMANLAAASGGDNAAQLTLATYVLTRRFEDVVAAANARLVTMSDGRYELSRSLEREDVRSRRTGLAMKVLDHRTESERDPRTLSGGETFYVSLCLALGLADVVTAEAGGIDLGTLFIDEGFGSLDQETLDVVLAELGRLRDGGRVVGVVSHVEALKASIAERIEVRCRPDGTSTLSVRA